MCSISFNWYLIVYAQVIRSKTLLLTTPAYATSEVVAGLNGDGVNPMARRLADVNYPPVASVTVAYPNSAFKVCA